MQITGRQTLGDRTAANISTLDRSHLPDHPELSPNSRAMLNHRSVQKRPKPDSSRLCVITSFFNPCRQARRLTNYRIFRARLNAPLIAVELGYNDTFELEPKDADVLVRVSGADVLWQKERLLNIALGYLPAECDSVAWIDSDVIFERDDWPQLALAELENHAIAQLFRRRVDLPPDTLPEQLGSLQECRTYGAVGIKIKQKRATAEDLVAAAHLTVKSSAGFAWAARRELLDAHGFYDTCIIGSGDRAILAAAHGSFDAVIDSLVMGPSRARHYLRWAEPVYESVRGTIGCIDGDLFHLWHTSLANRRADLRHVEFSRFDFDPYHDIALAEGGCYRWSSDKSEMHAHVLQYLQTRADESSP